MRSCFLLILLALGALVAEEPAVPALNLVYQLDHPKLRFVLGDPVVVRFRARTTAGEAQLHIWGPQRGYVVTAASHADGLPVRIVQHSVFYATSGPRPVYTLSPDSGFDGPVALAELVAFDRPGRYTIELTQRGGFPHEQFDALPRATISIDLLAPTPAAIEGLVNDWRALGQEHRWLPLQMPADQWPTISGWRWIAAPQWIDHLRRWALEGEVKAVVGLDSIWTPQSTAALIDIIEQAPAPVVNSAWAQLLQRLPNQHPTNPHLRDRVQPRISACWDPQFADRVATLARSQRADSSSLALTALTLIGDRASDMEEVIAAFDALVADAWSATPGPDEPPAMGGVHSLRHQLIAMAARLAWQPEDLASPGRAVAWMAGLNQDTEAWHTALPRLRELIRSTNLPLAAVALHGLPDGLISELLPDLARAIGHADPRLAYAATLQVYRGQGSSHPDCRAALVALATSTAHSTLLNLAWNALINSELPRLTHVELLVARLDNPALTHRALRHLMRNDFLFDRGQGEGSRSDGGRSTVQPDEARACAAAWRRWIGEHRALIDQDMVWPLDASVPAELSVPGYHFSTNLNGIQAPWPPRR